MEKHQIYFLQSGGGPIKIGFAVNIQARIDTLQLGNPEKLKLLKTVEGSVSGEKEIHRRFSKDKIRGEWFNPTDELLSFIAKIGSSYTSIKEKRYLYQALNATERFYKDINFDLPEFGELKKTSKTIRKRKRNRPKS